MTCSAPHSSLIPSLNYLIPSEEFSLKYASVDLAIQAVINISTDAWLSKADISDAFKLLPIEPALWWWHNIKWKDSYYFATKLTFGSKSSLWLFRQVPYVDPIAPSPVPDGHSLSG